MEKRFTISTFNNVRIVKYVNSAKITFPFRNLRQGNTLESLATGFSIVHIDKEFSYLSLKVLI